MRTDEPPILSPPLAQTQNRDPPDPQTALLAASDQPTIRVGVHRGLTRLPRDKAEKKRLSKATAKGWQEDEFTLDGIAAHLDTGASIAAVFPNGHRSSYEGAQAQFIPVDFDQGSPDRAQIEADARKLECAAIIGETATAGHYRVIIPLAEPICDPEQYRALVARVTACFQGAADPAGCVIGQPWFGHRSDTTTVIQGAFLTLEAIQNLPAPPTLNETPLTAQERTWRREPEPPAGTGRHSVDEQSLYAEYNRMVRHAIERSITRRSGQHFGCLNPDHEDKDPSARIGLSQSGDPIYFCTCAPRRAHSLSTVASWLNLPTFREFKRERWLAQQRAKPQRVKPAAATQNAAYCHPNGMPHSWLLTVSKAFPGSNTYLPFTRLWFEAPRQGLIDPQDFTINDLFAARDRLGIPLSDSAIRGCMKGVEGLFWDLNARSVKKRSNPEITSGGRPEQHFRARPLAEIEPILCLWAARRIEEKWHLERGTAPALSLPMNEALAGDARRPAEEITADAAMRKALAPDPKTRTSAWLARKTISELARELKDLTPTSIPLARKDVRVALTETILTSEPDTPISYAEIALRTGSSKGGAAALVKRAKHVAVPQFFDCLITSPDKFEQEVAAACREKRGCPLGMGILERLPGGDEQEYPYRYYDQPRNRDSIAAIQGRGNQAIVRLRTINKFRPATPAELEQQPPQPSEEATEPPPRYSRRRKPARKRDEILRYYGPGYNPSIILIWLKTHLRRLGWKEREEWFFDLDPVKGEGGEGYDLSLAALVQAIEQAAQERGFLEFAASLGAEVGEISA